MWELIFALVRLEWLLIYAAILIAVVVVIVSLVISSIHDNPQKGKWFAEKIKRLYRNIDKFSEKKIILYLTDIYGLFKIIILHCEKKEKEGINLNNKFITNEQLFEVVSYLYMNIFNSYPYESTDISHTVLKEAVENVYNLIF